MGIKKKKDNKEISTFYLTDKPIKKAGEEIIDWTYKMQKIDEFWINELQELINFGGHEIIIKTIQGGTLKGILTGVNFSYLQLNNSIRIFFDDIKSIYLQ